MATKNKNDSVPLIVAEAATATRTRRNSSSVIERTDRFSNIEEGLVPFNYSAGGVGGSSSNLDIRDAVILCQKAYYNFSVFRNTIDLMTEFSVGSVYYREGSKKSRDFFEALFNKINLWSLQDKFFREYFRSGNVFIYRFDAKVKSEELLKITQTYGAAESTLPARYVVLNPADIQAGGNISFTSGRYFKLLTDYEVERLRNPKTEEDVSVFEALPDDVKKLIATKGTKIISLALDPAKTCAVFYKKQDYEPLAVPMGYPVLEDLNAKAEMRKMDMAVTRTMQQAVLLVTLGTEPEKGGVNQKNLEAMQKLFQNESVGRVLIADYTTKAEFVIPDIAALLDPKKYEVIDKDINIGLNNILVGGEKYANQTSKVEVFLGRLEQAKQSFINEFLLPEIKRIAKELGFKNYPVPYFEESSIKDNSTYAKIYSRLVEIGVLTPEQGIVALETNRLPDEETSLEGQRRLKTYKDEGLYSPMIGGTKDEAGRPMGTTGIPQTTKKVSPIGQSKALYSSAKIKEIFILADKLGKKVSEVLCKTHKIKELNKDQESVAEQIAGIIMANEKSENWLTSVKDYIANPVDKNKEVVKEIQSIAYDHQVDSYLASILYASKP